MAGNYEGSLAREVGLLAAKGAAIGVFVWVAATWVVPRLLERILHEAAAAAPRPLPEDRVAPLYLKD